MAPETGRKPKPNAADKPTEAPLPIINGRIRELIERTKGHRAGQWMLTYVGEDEFKKQSELISYLKGRRGPQGEKMVTSGYSYWGIGPTSAWIKACEDVNYMMRQSTEIFPELWGQITDQIPPDIPLHYASLGVGTGRKDVCLLEYFAGRNSDLHFFPVDMSPEMLRVGVLEIIKARIAGLRRCQTLPLQLNFDDEENLRKLRNLMNKLNNGSPTFFGLLGNTLSNFDDDVGLLTKLCSILDDNDLLLLEVISTTSRPDEQDKQLACEEYEPPAFREFALSSLLQATDLDVTERGYLVESEEEFFKKGSQYKALQVKAYYTNPKNEDTMIRLVNGEHVRFEADERIRVYLTRKYSRDGLDRMLERSNLAVVHRVTQMYQRPFSFELILVKKRDK